MGHPTTFHEGPFSVESTCRIIRDYGITNLAGSPTAYRCADGRRRGRGNCAEGGACARQQRRRDR